jgi:ATP-binding cassette subfamily C protein LapB
MTMAYQATRIEPDDSFTNAQTPADACLRPILGALDWTGELRHLHEAMPDGHQIADFDALCEVLARLKYDHVRLDLPPAEIDDAALPGLLKRPDGDIWVVMKRPAPGSFEVFTGRAAQIETRPAGALRGEYYHVRAADPEAETTKAGRFGWISGLLAHEADTVRLLFVLAFVINCLALTLPLYLMLVFDMAIGARSLPTLVTLAGVALLVVAAEVSLRELRARAISRLAVRTQMAVMRAVIARLLHMPISYVKSAPVAGQLNRLRGFESVRDIFSGPLASSLLDVPFILVFVIAVFAIGGALGWVLVAFILAIAALVAASVPKARATSQQSGKARAQTRLFRIDLARHDDTIRDAGAQDVWRDRYRDLIARQISAGAAAQRVSFTEQTIAQALSMITGATVVGLGALQVMAGQLSIGALVALMAIVWRILSPIQTAFLNLNRIFQALDTANQVNRVMQLPQESISGEVRRFYRRVRGDIALENVGFRYTAQGTAALRGVDLTIRAGEFVVLTGLPGAGRNTLLKLIAGQYPLSFGRIRIDGSDIQQFDLRELRRTMALVNDEQVIFSGTLRENLMLANPLAREAELREALAAADLGMFVDQLPCGLDTDLTPLLGDGLDAPTRQKLRLARAYVQEPRIYLLNEPDAVLDQRGQVALLHKLRSLKAHATILVATSNPGIIGLADRIVQIHAGRVVTAGEPAPAGLGRLADAPRGAARTLAAPDPECQTKPLDQNS